MLERVWNGTIIVKVGLYPDTSEQAAIPFFASIKRIHYPNQLIPLVSRFYSALGDSTLSSLIASDSSPVWFEFKFIEDWHPVHWQRPLGVISDIAKMGCITNRDVLELRLMLTGIIPAELPSINADESHARQLYFNALKEAEALRRTRHRRVMEMGRDEQNSLWDAVRGSNTAYSRFSEINANTVLKDPAKGLPLKLYVCGEDDREVQVRTGPVLLYSGSLSIGEAVCSIIGFEPQKLITHGIQVDSETPVSVLLDTLTYPDNLLHIIVINRK